MTRGQMIKYIIKNRIDNLEELKNFSFNGYKFDHTLSSDKKYVFIKQD
ncbi:peroxide stress protein YaaA [Terrisporobacter othiniensis]